MKLAGRNMTEWETIACQRGHDHHDTHLVSIDLSVPTSYADLVQVPVDLGELLRFDMEVWVTDPDARPNVDGSYCPANDVVSAAIDQTGVWEQDVSVLIASAVRASRDEPVFIDVGAHLGWHSLVAQRCGADVIAVEADPDVVEVLTRNLEREPLGRGVDVWHHRVTFESQIGAARPVAMVKIDIEGGEFEAVSMLAPLLSERMVSHMLIEVSPVFDDGYADLVEVLIRDAGFEAWVLPPKSVPPASIADGAYAMLEPGALHTLEPDDLRATINAYEQVNVWFSQPGAPL